MNKKGIKTSIVAFVVLALGVATVAAFILDKIDSEKFSLIMGSLGVMGTFVIGYFAKDQTASHTKK